MRTDARTRFWPFRTIATRYLDPVVRPLARWLPSLGILIHTGRKTGRTYRTPINVFRRGGTYLFLLTYGSDAQWVKNVLATGECSLETRGELIPLVEPELVTDPTLGPAPALPRFVERRIAGATQYLRMHAARPTRVIADGYDRMAERFATWNASRPQEGRRWFLDEVLTRLPPGSAVLEVGCGPGTDAAALSEARGYVGIDLSPAQLAIARRRVDDATFVVADLVRLPFRAASFDGIVAFYAFNHVPQADVQTALADAFECLRPEGYLMLAALPTAEAEDRVEEWLDTPMFFAGVEPGMYERALRAAGFDIEFSDSRFPTREWWGTNEPLWVVARKPSRAAP